MDLINQYNMDKAVKFRKIKTAVPFNYRIEYRICQIILIIGLCSTRGACSLTKLDIISYALADKNEEEKLISFINRKNQLGSPSLRNDTVLYRALKFALADKVIKQKDDGKFLLTKLGNEILSELIENESLLTQEKHILQQIGNKLSEAKLQRLHMDRREKNDCN